MRPPGDWSAVTPERWSRGWRRLVLAAGMLAFPLVTAAQVPTYTRGADTAIGYAIVAGFCCACACAGAAAARLAWTTFWLMLGIMTALFVAALPYARTDAFFLCAVIVSLAAVFVRRHVALTVASFALASLVVPCLVRSWGTGPGWGQALAIVFTSLTVYAFSEIARANRSLVEARAEVARLASEAERARIARDLHDLLGHSLTAITVKSGLARRLAASESSRALPEITEVETLTRQALADVRAAVSGYRDVTLVSELARGRELLRASGVTADLPTAADVVDGAHQELFGWVVREGLTNVARHARASRCTVMLSASAVEVRDDGVGAPASDGNGLSGLRERVAAAGGRVEAGPMSPRGWRLRVSLEERVATP
ncbi:sensor histidine kinase [Streptomyces sp. S186]|uniref:sensor histidine kinase n=1 Tax=Streptomyces sp. S186 TaxID=3434395 RepID=UPI003F67596A